MSYNRGNRQYKKKEDNDASRTKQDTALNDEQKTNIRGRPKSGRGYRGNNRGRGRGRGHRGSNYGGRGRGYNNTQQSEPQYQPQRNIRERGRGWRGNNRGRGYRGNNRGRGRGRDHRGSSYRGRGRGYNNTQQSEPQYQTQTNIRERGREWRVRGSGGNNRGRGVTGNDYERAERGRGRGNSYRARGRGRERGRGHTGNSYRGRGRGYNTKSGRGGYNDTTTRDNIYDKNDIVTPSPRNDKKGNIYFQKEWYTREQMEHIKKMHGTGDRTKILFGDNDTDKFRNNNRKRVYFGGQAVVMGYYDKTFGYGITTSFYESAPPNLNAFKILMDKQFKPLQTNLLKGYDVVISKPNNNDITRNKKRYYKNGKQMIFHNIGTGIAALPFQYVLYIQSKIDELRNYAQTTETVLYYNYTANNTTKNTEHTGVKSMRGHWICGQCNVSNFDTRNQCRKCRTMRSFNDNRATRNNQESNDQHKATKPAISPTKPAIHAIQNKQKFDDVKSDQDMNIVKSKEEEIKMLKLQLEKEKLERERAEFETQRKEFEIRNKYEKKLQEEIATKKSKKVKRFEITKHKTTKGGMMHITKGNDNDIDLDKKQMSEYLKKKDIGKSKDEEIKMLKLQLEKEKFERERAEFEAERKAFVMSKKYEQKLQEKVATKKPKNNTINQSDNDNKVIEWKWKKENNEWISYENVVSKSIEKCDKNESYQYTHSGNNQTYKITKSTKDTAIQININSNTSKKVKRFEITAHKTTKGNDHDIDTKQISEYLKKKEKELENQRLKNVILNLKKKDIEKEKEKYRIKAEHEEKEKLETEKEYEKLKKENYLVIWEWKDDKDGEWKLYKDKINTAIEALGINKSLTFTANNGQTYKVTRNSKIDGIQKNVKTSVSREIRRREQGRGHIEYPNWWNNEGLIQNDINDEGNDGSSTGIQYATPQLIEMNLSDETAKEVVKKFYSTSRDHSTYGVRYENINVIKIESVQNQRLYDKYWNERSILKKSIGEDKLNERCLWHGTKSEDTMETIEKQGFRKEYSSTAAWGNGTYFAVNSGYSVGYSSNNNGIYKMFLCKVLCGESTVGNSSYELKKWPKKSNELIYDSLVSNGKDIYVIHDDVKAYPMFVITFKTK